MVIVVKFNFCEKVNDELYFGCTMTEVSVKLLDKGRDTRKL